MHERARADFRQSLGHLYLCYCRGIIFPGCSCVCDDPVFIFFKVVSHCSGSADREYTRIGIKRPCQIRAVAFGSAVSATGGHLAECETSAVFVCVSLGGRAGEPSYFNIFGDCVFRIIYDRVSRIYDNGICADIKKSLFTYFGDALGYLNDHSVISNIHERTRADFCQSFGQLYFGYCGRINIPRCV